MGGRYRAGAGFRGRGYGSEAQHSLVRYLFAHTPVNRVEATTEIANVAERRALDAVTRVVGEGEAGQADQAAAGHLDLVADHGRGRSRLRHQSAASVNRSAPSVRHSAATPQATMPSPRRSQAIGSPGREQVDQAAPAATPARPRRVRATSRPGGASALGLVTPDEGTR